MTERGGRDIIRIKKITDRKGGKTVSEKANGFGFLSGNALKYIAAITMLIDHAGLLLFPRHIIFRIIGRLAFPIFAFMIAEGCRYTRNKLKYFLSVFLLGFTCQVVYFLYDGSLDMCILITFSLSILIIYALQDFKRVFFSPDKSWYEKTLSGAIFLVTVVSAYFFNKLLPVDYGFLGIMVPVFASVLHPSGENTPRILQKFDKIYFHVAAMALALVVLSWRTSWVQWYSLLALPFLLLYTGKRGRANTKYFFYIFYPVHLAALELISSYLL